MHSIEIRHADGTLAARAEGETGANLVYREAYRPGDRVLLASEARHLHLGIDQAVQGALVYLPAGEMTYEIPFGDAQNGYAPQAFAGDLHALWIRPARPEEISARRSIAHNPADQHEETGAYPHAVANVETRGEAQFWARNAIDGTRFNDSHGSWPYHSWGIGERRDAWLRVDFGRPVVIDEVALTLRADFPHDAWWREGTLDGSDGFSVALPLKRTGEAQHFPIGRHTVTWVRLRQMIKADDPSPFPALTQLEVFGHDAG